MLITLTTDFGLKDPFVGVMKGVIARINPQAQVIDLTHGVPAQDTLAAAFVLRHSIEYFPRGTVHMVVVDPGVGSSRRPLLIEGNGHFFIGPDNGVLSLAVGDAPPARIVQLSNAAYQLHPASATFHGRDIFAPAAAYLSRGIPPAELGEPVSSFVKVTLPKPIRAAKTLLGEIIYIDKFGNLFTNIEEGDLRELGRDQLDIVLRDLRIHGVVANYAAGGSGGIIAVLNSWGLLEIAANRANAAHRIGARIGDKVEVIFGKGEA